VSCYPALFSELTDRGWSEADCAALASGNILRVLRDAEAAATVIQSTRGPSAARIEQLDGKEPEAD
jgi:membrane dipeptidase